MNDFYLAVPLRDAMPQAAVEGRQLHCGWFEFEGVLQRRRLEPSGTGWKMILTPNHSYVRGFIFALSDVITYKSDQPGSWKTAWWFQIPFFFFKKKLSFHIWDNHG